MVWCDFRTFIFLQRQSSSMEEDGYTHLVTVSDITEKYVWFMIDSVDDNIGVPIPKNSSNQTSQTELTISSLEIGDKCRLTFVPKNRQCTAWYAGPISVVEINS